MKKRPALHEHLFQASGITATFLDGKNRRKSFEKCVRCGSSLDEHPDGPGRGPYEEFGVKGPSCIIGRHTKRCRSQVKGREWKVAGWALFPGSEAGIMQQVIEWLCSQQRGHAQYWPTKTVRDTGTPDIFGCWQGRCITLEVKVPGEKPTLLQEQAMARWRAAGAIAGVVTSIEDVQRLLANAAP